jgi:endonuclease YncB( thermonuclease family)
MRRFLAPLLLILLLVSCAGVPPIGCREAPGHSYDAVWLPDEYMDGDTFTALIGGWTYRIRVAAVNAPERDTEAGPAATAFTRAFLEAAGGRVTLYFEGLGDFCRPVCRVYSDQGELSALLLESGHAVPYED